MVKGKQGLRFFCLCYAKKGERLLDEKRKFQNDKANSSPYSLQLEWGTITTGN